MNWIRILACLLIFIAFGLFITALLTPWYRVHNDDGTDSRMGLYDSYDEPSHHNHTQHTYAQAEDISTTTYQTQDEQQYQDEFEPEMTPASRTYRPIQKIHDVITTTEKDPGNTDPAFEPYKPSESYHEHQQRKRQLQQTRQLQARRLSYNDGWVIAMRVLLLLTIILSFGLLIWSMYHAFVHDTDYGWDSDSSWYKILNGVSYILLFWAFLNGIIILSLASTNGPSDRYDQGYAFNSVAFTLLLFSMCLLCWPVPQPMLVAVPVDPPYGAFGVHPYPYLRPVPSPGRPKATTAGGGGSGDKEGAHAQPAEASTSATAYNQGTTMSTTL